MQQFAETIASIDIILLRCYNKIKIQTIASTSAIVCLKGSVSGNKYEPHLKRNRCGAKKNSAIINRIIEGEYVHA